MPGRLLGPILIGLAALLWASDAPLRYPLALRLDPTVIVFYEHLAATAALIVWILIAARSRVFRLRPGELALAALIGAGGSGLATLLYTASFSLINPTVAILLQKLQPLFVILIARAWLGEHPPRRLYAWGGVALLAAIALSVPDLRMAWGSPLSRGIVDAASAAMIWALATVAGKSLLRRHSPAVVTFWRYLFGLLFLTGFLIATSGGQTRLGLIHPTAGTLISLTYLSYVAGLLAMILYYKGLSRTTASVATIIELVYPISAVLVNATFLHQALSGRQAISAAILLLAVTRISRA